MIGNIVIQENPVTQWEQFLLSLPRERFSDESTSKRDMGGDYQASFTMLCESKDEALSFLNNGLDREVVFYSDDGIPSWRGFVNTIRLNTGTAEIENTLNDMANRVTCRYTPVGGGTVARSTIYENLISQARFGIKDEVISGGEISVAVANQIAENFLNLNFWPRPTLRQINLGGQLRERLELEVSCHGWSRRFGWRVYNQTATTGVTTASTVVAAIIAAIGGFVNTSFVDANSTILTQELDSDRRGDDLLGGIADTGDGRGALWVWGIEGVRDFYYRMAAPAERLT